MASPAAFESSLVAWDASEHLDQFSTFIFDCDGVLWRGSTLFPFTPKVLAFLRSEKKQVLFLTNNSTKSRAQYAEKFAALGIHVEPNELFCTSFAAAQYLVGLGFHERTGPSSSADKSPVSSGSSKRHKALVIGGGNGIAEELALAGIPTVLADDVVGTAPKTKEEFERFDGFDAEEIGAVVVGYDDTLTYAKVTLACLALHEGNGGAETLLVATNKDSTFPIPGGRVLPGGGSCVSMVETAAERTAVDCGKPEALFLELIRRKHSFDPATTLMVGDRLNTDVLFGHRGGLRTLLVETGVDSRETCHSDLEALPSFIAPGIEALLRSAASSSD